MNKQNIAALFVAFIVLAALFLIGSVIAMDGPNIEVQDVKITSLTKSTMDFEVILAITNPYPFGATVAELTYTITAQDTEEPLLIATGTTAGMDKIKIAGSTTTKIMVPAQISNRGVVSAGIQLLADGEMKVLVAGTAKIDLKVMQPQIPFSQEIIITKDEIISEIADGNEIIADILTAGAEIASTFLAPSK